MAQSVRIRSYQLRDLSAVAALEDRVTPYRPEDQAAVQAMFARAADAARQQDPRWMAPPATGGSQPPESYAAFWVAEACHGLISGTVAVQPFCTGEEMAPAHPLAQAWGRRDDVIELRRVRVAPEARGQGVGTQLCQAAIEWARAQGYALFVVNTTTPQVPALQLYHRLGFQVVGKSYIGNYELVWSALELVPAA